MFLSLHRPCSIFSVLRLLNTGLLEHIGLVVRMSILDTEVDGSNPSISMFFP